MAWVQDVTDREELAVADIQMLASSGTKGVQACGEMANLGLVPAGQEDGGVICILPHGALLMPPR